MAFLPESTNAQYSGSNWSVGFLGLIAIGTIVPGGIHYFLPDGGAGSIAGLDLSSHRSLIIGMFAWMGATQIPYGIAQLIVALRYRSLVPLFLALGVLERLFASLSAWVLKASDTGHHPPENYAVLVALPLLIFFLWLSLRPREVSVS